MFRSRLASILPIAFLLLTAASQLSVSSEIAAYTWCEICCPSAVAPQDGATVSTSTPTLKWKCSISQTCSTPQPSDLYFNIELYRGDTVIWSTTRGGDQRSVGIPSGKLVDNTAYEWIVYANYVLSSECYDGIGSFEFTTRFPPALPEALSRTHEIGTATEESRVQVEYGYYSIAKPTDLAGFEVAFDTSEQWTPSRTINRTIESQYLGHSEPFSADAPGSWYFHIAARDASGVWSSARTIGPFVITAPVVSFADAALDAAFRSQYELAGDETVYADDPRFTSLEASGQGIADLTGLEKLKSLVTVDLSNNRIRDVSALRGLSDLNAADLEGNLIWDITPLAENAGLGSGDWISLLSNMLDTDNQSSDDMTLIRWLEERGVQVLYSFQDPPLCGSNPPSLEGTRIMISEPTSPAEISGAMQAYVAHGFCVPAQDMETQDCEGYKFELYIDEQLQDAEYMTTTLERHGYIEGYSCYWVTEFPPHTLAEGEHTFRGVWSCDDCDDGNALSAERWRTVTVTYPDTDNPVVVGASASHLTIARADIASELALTIHYSEPMQRDGTADPTFTFTPDVSALLSLVLSAWQDADTFSATYEILDFELDEDYVTVVVAGGRDEAGNPQLDYESDLVLSIDTDPPWVTEPGGLDRFPDAGPVIVLADSDVGEDTIMLRATFTESMDTTATPEVAFTPDVSASLQQSVSTWTEGNTQYVRIYDVLDLDIETDWIDVTVSGARDVAGNVWDVHWPDEFRIDTENPEVESIAVDLQAGLDSPNLVVTMRFSDPMLTDGSADPVVTFQADAELLGGEWLDDNSYEAIFSFDSTSLPEGELGLSISGARDNVRNLMLPFSGHGSLQMGELPLGTLSSSSHEMWVPTSDCEVSISFSPTAGFESSSAVALGYYWGPPLVSDAEYETRLGELPVTWRSGQFQIEDIESEWSLILWGIGPDGDRITEKLRFTVVYTTREWYIGDVGSTDHERWSETSDKAITIEFEPEPSADLSDFSALRYYWGLYEGDLAVTFGQAQEVSTDWRSGEFEFSGTEGNWQFALWGVNEAGERISDFMEYNITFVRGNDCGFEASIELGGQSAGQTGDLWSDAPPLLVELSECADVSIDAEFTYPEGSCNKSVFNGHLCEGTNEITWDGMSVVAPVIEAFTGEDAVITLTATSDSGCAVEVTTHVGFESGYSSALNAAREAARPSGVGTRISLANGGEAVAVLGEDYYVAHGWWGVEGQCELPNDLRCGSNGSAFELWINGTRVTSTRTVPTIRMGGTEVGWMCINVVQLPIDELGVGEHDLRGLWTSTSWDEQERHLTLRIVEE
ncbi:hypothetical protein ACFLSW_03685 [Candidatus Bipolaricaulota bacterium]